jgi:hypothetical protein
MIGVKVHGDSNELHDILINPIDYIVKQNDEAILICNDQNCADSIFMEGPLRADIIQHFQTGTA